jgi:hypothetical protein
MQNVKNESDTSNNRGKWKHLKIIQTIPEQHTEKAQNQGTTKKKVILGTAYILQKVLMQKYKTHFMCEITLHVAQIVNTEQLQHYIP